MSLLKGFGKALGVIARTGVVLPIATAKDVVTLFGAVDNSGSAILRQTKKITQETEEV